MAVPIAAIAMTHEKDSSSVIHRIEAEAVSGMILHTNKYLQGNNREVRTMNHSFVTRLKYAFSPPENSEQAQIYKGVYQGLGLSYHDINPQLGNPVSIYLFQGATVKSLSERLSLNYEWDFGLTYGWKPYDQKTNPENHVIGSKTTAYIDLGLYLRWLLSHNWDLNIGATITHYSNGNTTIPNAGLNVFGIKASAAYYINRKGNRILPSKVPSFNKYWGYDFTLYGAWKRKGIDTENASYMIPGTYGVFGFNLNPLYHMNHWLNLGGSLDCSYDESAGMEINPEALKGEFWSGTESDIYKAAWYHRIALGVSARAEFVMPYFTINFGIGHNILNSQVSDFSGFYEILALKIGLTRQSYLHIGYSLYDFYYPNNLMLGLGLHL